MADLRSVLDSLSVDKSVKADAWDAFESSTTEEDFKAKFDKLPIPKEAKAVLWDLKFAGGTGATAQPDITGPERPGGWLNRAWTGAASELLGTDNYPLKPEIDQALSYPKTGPIIPRIGAALVEPTVKNVIGQAASGNISGAIGAGIVDATNFGILPKIDNLLARKTIGPLVKNVNPAKVENALQWAEREGIPTSVGQRTGQPGLQQAEAGLENMGGSATRAREFYNSQADAIAQTADNLASRTSKRIGTPFEVSKAAESTLTRQINQLKGYADRMYRQVRKELSANPVSLQVGSQTKLDMAKGKITVPIMKEFDTPVSLAPIQQELRPVFEDLQRSLPEARKAASPAYQALSQLMTGKDPYMSAMDFDRYLSAVKAITREGSSELLSTKSQGIAKKVIAESEKEFQSAIQGLNGATAKKLKSAREAVRKYHEIDEFRLDLGEPGAIYDRLVKGGNYTVDLLKQLKKQSPSDVKAMARTWMEQMIEKATKEGGFSRSAGIMADWNKLTTETKNILFGPQLRNDLDQFFLAAKKLAHPEGSRTTPMSVALGSYGAPFAALGALITGVATGNTEAGVGGAAVAIGGGYVVPNVMARLLFKPGAANMLTQVIKYPKTAKAVASARILQRLISGLTSESEAESQ